LLQRRAKEREKGERARAEKGRLFFDLSSLGLEFIASNDSNRLPFVKADRQGQVTAFEALMFEYFSPPFVAASSVRKGGSLVQILGP
jgi:hypothetical protein